MIEIQGAVANGTRIFGWKSEPPLTPFAPDYAHYLSEKKIFSEEECKEWNDYLLEQELVLLDEFRTSSRHTIPGLGDNSITSCHSHFNLLSFDFHLVAKLKDEIIKGVKTILELSNNTSWKDTLYAKSWFNVLRQGESMNEHSHGFHMHTLYGFHVTINAFETFTSYYHPVKFQEESFHVPNKIGYLVLFPSDIPHGVSPNNHETPRITLAGDIFPSTWLDEEHKPFRNKDLVEIGICDD